MKKLFSSQSGIGLVETLLAIGIAIIVITSMVSLALFTLRSSLTSKLSLAGTQKANQEIEQIRAYRDSVPWDTEFLATMATELCFNEPCHMKDGIPKNGINTEKPGTTEELKRSFILTDESADSSLSLIGVSVSVTWQIGQDAKSTHNYTEFSNWRNN